MHGIRNRWAALVVAGALALGTGCVRNVVRIVVEEDGSGQLVVTRTFSGQMVDLAGLFETLGRQGEAGGGTPFFDRAALDREAAQYGEGVKLVRAEPIRQAGARGSVAMYTFEDVSRLRLSGNAARNLAEAVGEDAPWEHGDEDDAPPPPDRSIRFQMEEQAGRSVLRVLMPELPDPPEEAAEPGAADDPMLALMFEDLPQAEAGADAHAAPAVNLPALLMGGLGGADMLRGAEFLITIETSPAPRSATGTIPVEGSASRFVLLHVDYDRVAASGRADALMRLVSSEAGMDSGQVREFHEKVPGFRYELEPSIVLRF